MFIVSIGLRIQQIYSFKMQSILCTFIKHICDRIREKGSYMRIWFYDFEEA